MLIVQVLFSGILLVDLHLLFVEVVQGPSYGGLLCFTIQVPLSWILLRLVTDGEKEFASKALFWEPVTIAWFHCPC